MAKPMLRAQNRGVSCSQWPIFFVGDQVETAINSAVTMHLGKVTYVKLGALAKFRIDNFVIDAGGTFDSNKAHCCSTTAPARATTCRCARRSA